MEGIKRDYHIVNTPQFNEVKLGDGNVEENCITVDLTYRKNANPKGYYIDVTLHTKGIDEHGSFYRDIYDFTMDRKKYVLAKEAGRKGKKAEAEAIEVFNQKAKLAALIFGKEIEEIKEAV